MDAPFKNTSCMAVEHNGGQRYFLDTENGEHHVAVALHNTINSDGVSDKQTQLIWALVDARRRLALVATCLRFLLPAGRYRRLALHPGVDTRVKALVGSLYRCRSCSCHQRRGKSFPSHRLPTPRVSLCLTIGITHRTKRYGLTELPYAINREPHDGE